MAQVLEEELVLVLEAVLELDTDRVWVPAAAVVLAAEFTKWAEGFPLLLRFRPRILTTPKKREERRSREHVSYG
jgi:allophanate hydrolase subunit 1